MNITPHYGQSYALLFDDDVSTDHPVGMVGPESGAGMPTEAVIAQASMWVYDGLEFENKRRSVVYYYSEADVVLVDLVISTAPDNHTVTTFKFKKEQA